MRIRTSGRLVALGTMLAAVAVGPAGASAAITVGETANPNQNCDGEILLLQATSAPLPAKQFTVPTNGVITSWSFRTSANPPATERLKVARPDATPNSFLFVGHSPPVLSPGANRTITSATRIPVLAGDVLGTFTTGPGFDCVREVPGFEAQIFVGDRAPGEVAVPDALSPDSELNVSALLEGDADGDGFGDETQDRCPSIASTRGPCPAPVVPPVPAPVVNPVPAPVVAPETTITKQPKAKTTSRRARFRFTADQPGADFQCALDGRGFKPCNSPRIIEVSRRRHNFQVRATLLGSTEKKPASAKWKVEKKKKKKNKGGRAGGKRR